MGRKKLNQLYAGFLLVKGFLNKSFPFEKEENKMFPRKTISKKKIVICGFQQIRQIRKKLGLLTPTLPSSVTLSVRLSLSLSLSLFLSLSLSLCLSLSLSLSLHDPPVSYFSIFSCRSLFLTLHRLLFRPPLISYFVSTLSIVISVGLDTTT